MSVSTRRWVVLVAALLTVALTARLGLWQLARASQKEALQSMLERRAQLPELHADELARTAAQAENQFYRHARVEGRWLDRTVYLENRQMHGQPGFFVLTPLELSPHDVVLVQRGWGPRDPRDRTRVPTPPSPRGTTEISGVMASSPPKLYAFGPEAGGTLRQNLDLAEFARETGLPLRPFTLLQTSDPQPPDGLLRDWPPPAINVQTHYGYAFQWFALAALTLVLYAWFQVVRPRIRRDAA